MAMHTSTIGAPWSSTTTPSSRYAAPGFMPGVAVAGLRVGGTKVGSPSGLIARIGELGGSGVGLDFAPGAAAPHATMPAARSAAPIFIRTAVARGRLTVT